MVSARTKSIFGGRVKTHASMSKVRSKLIQERIHWRGGMYSASPALHAPPCQLEEHLERKLQLTREVLLGGSDGAIAGPGAWIIGINHLAVAVRGSLTLPVSKPPKMGE